MGGSEGLFQERLLREFPSGPLVKTLHWGGRMARFHVFFVVHSLSCV